MVSTKLVDGRSSPAAFGWRFYQVEVHHSRMAPFTGLDRLWRVFDRLDTVPHIRSLGTVAVVGDSLVIGVGGSSATAWAYDVRTRELKRSPQPDWLNKAWATPPAAFSTDGRYIAYLSLDVDTSRLTVRTWPEGRIVARTAAVQPRQLNPPRGGSIFWRNPQQLEATFPVTDSGPSIAAVQAEVRGDGVEIVSWRIFPDYRDPDAHLSESPPQSRPPATAASDTTIRARFDRAAQEIYRLAPAAFPELPNVFRSELEQMGCMIPQLNTGERRWNAIRGQFAVRGQNDWAVLCSRNGTSVILVHWGGPASCPRELVPASDANYLQGIGGGQIGFSRLISRTTHYAVYPGENDTSAAIRQVSLDHDGIDDAFEGKASRVLFCLGGTWITYSGAD